MLETNCVHIPYKCVQKYKKKNDKERILFFSIASIKFYSVCLVIV